MLNNRLQPVRFIASLSLLVAATCFSAICVSAQSATFTRTDFTSLGNNHTTGDFNGDGFLDLAATAGNGVAVMLGNGNGSFRTKVAYPAGGFAQDLASGDFNGDGKLDLVVTINDREIGLAILSGNGDGTFRAPVNFPNSSHFDSPAVVATDLDNDGRLDVVAAHQIACYTAPCVPGRSITVWLGFGDGTFQLPWEMEVGTGMSRIVVSDFNRDSIKDLAIAGDRSQMYVLFGVGNGTFLQQPTITLTADTFGVDATDIDLGDFNGDGTTDLVVAIALNGSRTAILLGNTDGTFRRPLIITEPGSRVPQYQVVGDFNRDGFQDIALSLGFGTNGLLEILHGNGNGTFRAPVLYQQPPAKSSVSGGILFTGDFNRDGKLDIGLPITGASPGLAMLLNSTGGVSTPPPTPTPSPSPSPSPSPTPTPSPTPSPTPPPSADTLRLSRAEFDSGKRNVRIEATSTSSNATLQVFNTSTGQLIGSLSNNGGGRYSAQLNASANPQSITIRSNLGGTVTGTVTSH